MGDFRFVDVTKYYINQIYAGFINCTFSASMCCVLATRTEHININIMV